MAFAAAGGPMNFGGGYNVNPAPTGGQGAFGKVPGQIGLPPSSYQEALSSVPGLGQNATTASSDVQALLQGKLAPDTEDYIKRLVAAQGVASGVPGSGLNTADLVKSLGLTSEQLVTSGLGAYNSLLNTVGSLQLNPSLSAEIAQSNAMLGAAPDPSKVHDQLLRDLENMYGFTNAGPAGGTGGYGSTHILGPRPNFGGGGGGSAPWWSGGNPFAGDNQGVFVGGPGVGAAATNPSVDNTWQDYLKSTFGGADYGYGPASFGGTLGPGAEFFGGSDSNPMDPYTESYLNPTPGVSGGFDWGGDMNVGTV